MDKDPILKYLVSDQDWHIWMDDRRSLLSYPVVSYLVLRYVPTFPPHFAHGRNPTRLGVQGDEYAVHCFCHDDIHPKETLSPPFGNSSWKSECSKDRLLQLYSDCNPVYVSVPFPGCFPPGASFPFSYISSSMIDMYKLTVAFLPFSSRRLLEIVESPIILARHLVLPRCETWVHESHTIALLGEAAHPNLVSGVIRGSDLALTAFFPRFHRTFHKSCRFCRAPDHHTPDDLSLGEQPCSNQSTGMCIEDAAMFGGLFSPLRSWDQVPSLMEAYQDLRQDRTHFVACQDQYNADITWCPPGPHRDARDVAMRADEQRGTGEFSEHMLKAQWDTVSEVFAYSASEAAANWWAGWGMLAERAKRRTGDSLLIEMTVVPQGIFV